MDMWTASAGSGDSSFVMLKRVILTLSVLLSFVAGGCSGRGDSAGLTKAEADARIEHLLRKAERRTWFPGMLNDVIHEFRSDPARALMTPEDRRQITKRWIKIFYAIDESPTNMANKERIMEIIGFSDNSPEAHEFFLKVMDSESERYREMAMWGIRRRGLHGDDLYDKLSELERKGKISRIRSLQRKADANPPRALEEMKAILRTTKDLDEFSTVGVNLPEDIGETPEVLDLIIDRYIELKKDPATAARAAGAVNRAVEYKRLWRYIALRDGWRLQTALELMRERGVCGPDDLPLLESRLKDRDMRTREAVADFLCSQVERKNLGRQSVQALLRAAAAAETDVALKRKMGAMSAKFSD